MADLGWEDDDATWGGTELSSKEFVPVYLTSTDFYALGYDSSSALDSYIERLNLLHIPGTEIQVSYFWPQIIGPVGYDVQIYIGVCDIPDGAIDWEGPYDFTIGEDEYVDFCISGRYISLRIESTNTPSWKLQGYDLDYEVVGQH